MVSLKLPRMGVLPAVALLLAPACGLAAAAPAASEPQSAVWTQKELTFVYQGFTTRYSCDGLRDKLRDVLLDLGARKKDLQIHATGCTSATGRPDPFPGIRAKISVLTPAAGSADEKPVAAHWQPLDLKLKNSYFVDSGECELVEQIKAHILPLFAVRKVELNSNCIPHQATATRPTLKMEVLAPDQPAGADSVAGAPADAPKSH